MLNNSETGLTNLRALKTQKTQKCCFVQISGPFQLHLKPGVSKETMFICRPRRIVTLR